jgi:hypothetical protein
MGGSKIPFCSKSGLLGLPGAFEGHCGEHAQTSPRRWLLQRAASIATKTGHRDEPQSFSGQKSDSAMPVLLQSFLHTAVPNVLAGFDMLSILPCLIEQPFRM